MEASWRRLGGILGRLGRLGGVLEASWRRLGGVLGASWGHLGRLGGVLEAKIATWPEKVNLKLKNLTFTRVS